MGFLPPEFVDFVRQRVRARRVPRLVQLFGPVLALYLAVKVGSRTFVTLDWLERHQDFGKKTSPKEPKRDIAKRMREMD